MKQVNEPVTWLHIVTFIQPDISGPLKSFPTELWDDLGYVVFIKFDLLVGKVQWAENLGMSYLSGEACYMQQHGSAVESGREDFLELHRLQRCTASVHWLYPY